jgi:hypothetical protein
MFPPAVDCKRVFGVAGVESYFAQRLCIQETMGSARIKQHTDGFASNRECAHHYWCSFWNITHRSETESALPDLSNLLLALLDGFGNLSLIRLS